MTNRQTPGTQQQRQRRWCRQILFLVMTCASIVGVAPAIAQLTPATAPLTLVSQPAPNVIVTIDDSGSMRWAYTPDESCQYQASRRMKAADFNPMYYNPKVRYPLPVDHNGAPLPAPSFQSAPINGFAPNAWPKVNLFNNYRPTLTYDPETDGEPYEDPDPCQQANPRTMDRNNFMENPTTDSQKDFPANQARSGVPAYYYRYDENQAGCTAGDLSDEDCYVRVTVGLTSGPATVDINGDGVVNSADADETQNFAIWYSFYRTRNLATVSAASLAMAGIDPSMRIAWQALRESDCSSFTSPCQGWDGTQVSRVIRRFNGDHKENFYRWLFRLPADSNTPLRTALRRAGEYYRTTGDNGPYGFDPNQSPSLSGTQYACRANFHIMMTDGLWNDGSGSYCGSESCNNKDNSTFDLGASVNGISQYSPRAPYADSNSNSLADVALYYWATDLNPGLANQVRPSMRVTTSNATNDFWNPRNDPATWQHMVNFTVGLGLSGFLKAPNPTYGTDTFSGQFDLFESGTAAWPSIGSSAGRVYDLWHAAVNSRGDFFAASDATQLSAGLKAAVDRIRGSLSAGSPPFANSISLSSSSVAIQGRYSTSDWSGEVRGYRINANGTLGTLLWSTNDTGRIPAAGSRNIVTWNGASAIAFRDTTLTAAEWAEMALPASTQSSIDIVNYLRGDQSMEASNNGPYRTRSTRVGDIVNFAGVVAADQNYGRSLLAEGNASTGGESYASFLSTKRSRTKILYIGANDGMLHGIEEATGNLVFSYMPRAVLPKVASLASQSYAHQYFVDGAAALGDAFFSSKPTGQKWRNILVATTGAGAKAVFAIDVTDPAAISSESTAPGQVLWEVSSSSTDFADLGYTIGRAAIVKLNNGQWAAAIANGYGSTSNCASLYLVDLATGARVKRIDTETRATDTTPCAAAPANGLSSPTPYDANGDGITDFIYAGDLKGNLWKFDLTATNANSWGLAFSGNPLFTAVRTAGQLQPITSAPALGLAPATAGGIYVYFGTGRFVTSGDPSDVTVQSLYGIIDTGTAISGTDRSLLQQQTYTESTIDADGNSSTTNDRFDVRDFSDSAVAGRGWYVDFVASPASGERIIASPVVRSGRLFVVTMIPRSDPCSDTGGGWLLALNPWTGGDIGSAVFDIDGSGTYDAFDDYSGVRRGDGTGLAVAAEGGTGTVVVGKPGGLDATRTRFDVLPPGRSSWRQVMN
jgi:type IV pilus assembly protein PilY1